MRSGRNIIDEGLRLRVLEVLYQGSSPWRSSSVLPSRLEVTTEEGNESVVVVQRRSGSPNSKKKQTPVDTMRNDIYRPGMLYEILAMRASGWLSRGSLRKNGVHYWLTGLGIKKFWELQPKVRAEGIKKTLESANTHHLLSMLKASRYTSFYDDDDCDGAPTTEEIKEELAKRPHVERRAERRARLSKKEKGDARRELAKK